MDTVERSMDIPMSTRATGRSVAAPPRLAVGESSNVSSKAVSETRRKSKRSSDEISREVEEEIAESRDVRGGVGRRQPVRSLLNAYKNDEALELIKDNPNELEFYRRWCDTFYSYIRDDPLAHKGR